MQTALSRTGVTSTTGNARCCQGRRGIVLRAAVETAEPVAKTVTPRPKVQAAECP